MLANMNDLPLVVVSACALLDADNRVLIAQRPRGKNMAGLWEFPGGKLEIGETPENALIRELKEELAIDFNLLLALFVCRKWSGTVAPLECQVIKWVKPKSLKHFDMPPADKPLIAMLRDFL